MVVEFDKSGKKFKIQTADNFQTRFKELMGKSSMPEGEALLLEHCDAVHGCFMKFPIDVIYLDADRKVIGIETIKPWHDGTMKHLFAFGKIAILEVNAGEADGIELGEEMKFAV